MPGSRGEGAVGTRCRGERAAVTLTKSPTPISELAAGFVHLKACSTHAAEHVDTNDRHSGRYTELTRDGGRGFASPFLHRRKADPTARPYPLPGTLTFFGTVFMAL
jgi:hypothetical protein